MPFLEYRDASGKGIVLVLERKEVVIGRNPECDVRIDIPSVSRRHARLYAGGGAGNWIVMDLASSHGTFLNRVRLPPNDPRVLANGDRIKVGDAEIAYSLGDAPAKKAQHAIAGTGPAGSIVVEHAVDAGELMRTWIGAQKLDVSQLVARPDRSVARLVKAGATGLSTDPPPPPEAALRMDADVASHLLTLVRIGNELRQCSDIDAVCRTSVEMAMRATGAVRGVLARRLEDGGEFVPVVQLALAASPDARITDSPGIQVSRTFVDRVVEKKVALVATDTGDDEMLSAARSVVAQDIRSILCAPLWSGADISGWIYLDSVGGAKRFQPDFADLVAAIGHHAAAEIRVRDEQARRRNLGRFLSADVIRHIDAEALAGRLEPALSAREQEVTILFTDIKGFTAMSERLGPKAMKAFLDRYFDRMTRILVDDHRGTLDKYIGDAIMALFGAPYSRGPADEARAAVSAALAMREEIVRMREENPDWAGLDVRTGINGGKVVAGMLGSPQRRMEYSVIGDVVNVASRLESAGEPGRIQIGESTFEAVKDAFLCEPAGERIVKNRTQPVRSWWVTGAR